MSANYFVNKISQFFSGTKIRWLLNMYPAYLGAGIKVISISPDFLQIKVTMKLRWYNANLFGTQFGGSLYSMTDPFFALMIFHNLGSDYVVWDKAAKIDFITPGISTVYATFNFTAEEIAEVKNQVDILGKYVFDRPVNIVDDAGKIIASVVKTLYVRRNQKGEKFT